jgi:aminopeptidase N
MSLEQSTAEFRASVIRADSIHYNFNVILLPEYYHGLAELTFYLENTSDFTALPIDFSTFQLQQVVLNSKDIHPSTSSNSMLLPTTYLQKGRNRLSVVYRNHYDKDRKGCMSFQADGEQYVYTQFEPYGAYKVFPCFDQPDLKSTMKLSVVTPSGWTVISNQPNTNNSIFHPADYKQRIQLGNQVSEELLNHCLSAVSTETKMTFFEPTEPLSTYLFAFTAGPFA